MSVSLNTQNVVDSIKQPKVEQNKPEDFQKTNKISTKTKVVVGTGLLALAATGIYIATKGKAKVKPKDVEKTFSNGNKAVIEECVLLTEKGLIPARKISIYDKSGNIIKQKSKAITKSINEATGKKYTTIRQGFYQNGKFVGKNEVNRYYSKDGNLLLKTNKSVNNDGFQVITKQAPVDKYVLKGEKQELASNALNFSDPAGTSAMAQSQRTNGLFKHNTVSTAEEAKETIKFAQEKGYSPRCGVLELEKL